MVWPGSPTMPSRSFESIVSDFVSELANQIAHAVRAQLATQPAREQGSGRVAKISSGRAAAGKKLGKSAGRNIPSHCVYAGCTNAHKGPRFSFLCAEHVGIPKSEKKKSLAAWKEGRAEEAAPRAGTPKRAVEKTGRKGRRGSLD